MKVTVRGRCFFRLCARKLVSCLNFNLHCEHSYSAVAAWLSKCRASNDTHVKVLSQDLQGRDRGILTLRFRPLLIRGCSSFEGLAGVGVVFETGLEASSTSRSLITEWLGNLDFEGVVIASVSTFHKNLTKQIHFLLLYEKAVHVNNARIILNPMRSIHSNVRSKCANAIPWTTCFDLRRSVLATETLKNGHSEGFAGANSTNNESIHWRCYNAFMNVSEKSHSPNFKSNFIMKQCLRFSKVNHSNITHTKVQSCHIMLCRVPRKHASAEMDVVRGECTAW